jgi:hypothetical protein
MNTITFESIEKSIHSLNIDAMTAVPDTASRTQRAITTYKAVRPIVAALTVFPLLPAQWQAALKLFLVTFDAFAQSAPEADGDFKAGKDLKGTEP